MNLFQSLLLIVSCSLVAAENQYTSGGYVSGCPADLQFISNLDETAIQGGWYAHFLTVNSTEMGCNEDCWTQYFANSEEHQLWLTWCCQNSGDLNCKNNLLNGILTISTAIPGFMTFNTFSDPQISYNAFFIGADYDNYLLGYICGYNCNGPYERIYAFSRTPVKPPTFEATIFGIMDRNGISRDIAVPLVQGPFCHYPFHGCSSY